MVVRSKGGKLEVRKPAGFGHNSGEDDLSNLERLFRKQRIDPWPIDRLRPNGRNLRLHSPRKQAALKRAMVSFGVLVPLIVDPTGNVLAGHARLAVAVELGLQEVPVIVVSHLTDVEQRLYAIADNRIQELSTWDMPQLKLEFEELSLPELNLDLSITGFDTAESDRILSSASTDIEARLSEPSLGAQAVADAVGVSVRYANAVLADHDTSIMRLIQTRRLERCRCALEDPNQTHRTVSEIAYGWGFSDMTHFGRRFKKAYGILPSEYQIIARRAGREGQFKTRGDRSPVTVR
jgi:AraC-like DNA-binding protein